jgi:ubiquinone/menaquinone biosynthesis C-methylase UbiE
MKKQSLIFLGSEGNNYFKRNQSVEIKKDIPFLEIEKIIRKKGNFKNLNILEIGCSSGLRLSKIQKKYKCNCYGLEPSKLAIKKNLNKKVIIVNGTADKIKFPKNKFDIIFFGFCLYVVDLEDLFKIADETNRVIKKNGHIIIWDFYSKKFKRVKYKHDKRVFSIKYKFYKIFTSHPYYKLEKSNKFNYLNKKNFKTSIDVIERKEI